MNDTDMVTPNERPSFKRQRSFLTVFANDIPTYAAADVVRIRKSLNLTQPEFSKVIGVSYNAVKKWESGEIVPSGAVRHLLYLIDRDPAIIHQFIRIQPRENEAK